MFVTWISFRGTFQSFLDLTDVSAQSWYKVRADDLVNPTFKISLLYVQIRKGKYIRNCKYTSTYACVNFCVCVCVCVCVRVYTIERERKRERERERERERKRRRLSAGGRKLASLTVCLLHNCMRIVNRIKKVVGGASRIEEAAWASLGHLPGLLSVRHLVEESYPLVGVFVCVCVCMRVCV